MSDRRPSMSSQIFRRWSEKHEDSDEMIRQRKRRYLIVIIVLAVVLAVCLGTIIFSVFSSKALESSIDETPKADPTGKAEENKPTSSSSMNSSTNGSSFPTRPVKPVTPDIESATLNPPRLLAYEDTRFDWLKRDNWQRADNQPLMDTIFTSSSIKLTHESRKDGRQPIRTRQGWEGEKIIYIEWQNTDKSDTNIWMLNTKINPQFGDNNGWPYYGELDVFEMFTEDQRLKPFYDFSGNVIYRDVQSYGQMTYHFGGSQDIWKPCQCPSSHSKSLWFQNIAPTTSACSAQFQNRPNQRNSLAIVFRREGDRQQSIEIIQDPVFQYGDKGTVDIEPTKDTSKVARVVNSDALFWGIPNNGCPNEGHNPSTGFPFFEEFRLVLEEQSGEGYFEVHDVKVYKKR